MSREIGRETINEVSKEMIRCMMPEASLHKIWQKMLEMGRGISSGRFSN
jgi:hypothetical protein